MVARKLLRCEIHLEEASDDGSKLLLQCILNDFLLRYRGSRVLHTSGNSIDASNFLYNWSGASFIRLPRLLQQTWNLSGLDVSGRMERAICAHTRLANPARPRYTPRQQLGNTMKGALGFFTFLLLVFSTSHAPFPFGERAVIIRIDDVQDYGQPSSYALPAKMVLQYHISERIPALLSIIASRFGSDPQLIDQIQDGLSLGIFTIAIHGWHHQPLTNLSQSEQISEMQRGKNRLETVLGIKVLSFVPPYNKFNDATIEALKKNGLTLMSTAIYEGDIPREEDGITFIPQTVTTAEVEFRTDSWMPLSFESIIKQIEESWNSYGVAVVVIHPRQFVGEDEKERWGTYVQVIQWVRANEGKIIRPEPLSPATGNLDPFLLSVGLFCGMVSTLLIAFNWSAKRKSGNGHPKDSKNDQHWGKRNKLRKGNEELASLASAPPAPVLKYCSACGAAIPNPAAYCDRCGEKQ